ncbi:MAG: carbamoyltransferase HypF [Desulfovibrionaceae bacterium]
MPSRVRIRHIITGQVQGVGFRPFVYRTALARGLAGSVRNTPEGVVIEVQGSREAVAAFEANLRDQLPPLARIATHASEDIPPVEEDSAFAILRSTAGHGHTVLISPDTATCPDCLADMHDPEGRRHRYPFTNCTNCGPRYTITRSIPYDRPSTSMACFPLCERCREEYENPLDRRFHAQPNACPVCGPQVRLMDATGSELARGPEALERLARELAAGKLAAVKGLGGFHLSCDARCEPAVAELRRRKRRPSKPLAVMTASLDAARTLARIDETEARWLSGMERPIVLCERLEGARLAPSIAPDTRFLGLMLPYTPLHHVLFELLAELSPALPPALVMTSGNMSSEPICLGNREALARLSGIADLFLLHDRDILIRTDDSVLRVNPRTGQPLLLRRARGFTPSPVPLAPYGEHQRSSEASGEAAGEASGEPTVLGLGPELKCTLALTKNGQAFPSQHIGDMQNLETLAFHREISAHLASILQVEPVLAVHDRHPDYMTTAIAAELTAQGLETAALQHHFAHIHAVLAENRHPGPAVGIALDGTGYGEDGTIWGGEILYVDPATLEHQRLAHLDAFDLPGGEMAVREPWRIACALLSELGLPCDDGPWPWLPERAPALPLLARMLERRINTPRTSSCGRLFDAVSALLGLCLSIEYEGQAAILLEKAQDTGETGGYLLPLLPGEGADGSARLDTRSLFAAVQADLRAGVPRGIIARRFHLGLAKGFADAASAFAATLGVRHVAVSGGVMQNLTMATELPRALERQGFDVLEHTLLPPGDACISTGQAAWGRRLLALRAAARH